MLNEQQLVRALKGISDALDDIIEKLTPEVPTNPPAEGGGENA